MTSHKYSSQPTARRDVGDNDGGFDTTYLPPEPLGLFRLLSVALRHRFLITTTTTVAFAGTLILGLYEIRTYTSTATIIPQSRQEGGDQGLGGSVAAFVLAYPDFESNQLPDLYADLMHSRQLLDTVAEGVYSIRGHTGDTASLSRILDVRQPVPALRHAETVRRLGRQISATVVFKTGVINLAVETTDADVSRQIAERIIAGLNRFNLRTRQSQAAAERRFVEGRLSETGDSLRASENRLQAFLQANRAIAGSPQLQFTQDRIGREMTQRQALYTTLAQAYEQAKIDEVRNTPVITVIDPPNLPLRPDPRGLASRSLLAALLVAVLSTFIAMLRDIGKSGRQQGDEAFLALEQLTRETMTDIRHPFRAARRVLLPSRSRAPAGESTAAT